MSNQENTPQTELKRVRQGKKWITVEVPTESAAPAQAKGARTRGAGGKFVKGRA